MCDLANINNIPSMNVAGSTILRKDLIVCCIRDNGAGLKEDPFPVVYL